jgi:hypothetical protein
MSNIINIVRNIYNNVRFKQPHIMLGRWCHKEYTKICNNDIKSHLANIDNSSANTGLCVSHKKSKTNMKKI